MLVFDAAIFGFYERTASASASPSFATRATYHTVADGCCERTQLFFFVLLCMPPLVAGIRRPSSQHGVAFVLATISACGCALRASIS